MIIKSILDKIRFHPLFYIIVIISLLTAHFKELIYFTSIILIHELGHSIMALLFKYKVNRIDIYPYGGYSRLEYDINIPLYKELIILISGPIFQIIYVLIIYIIKIDIDPIFYIFNRIILIFNLLPIYPLDGGKILNIIISYFISYYKSLKITIYSSYFLYICFLFYIVLTCRNLTIYLIVISLGINIYKEINKNSYYFNKFLLERLINNYVFRKKKIIKNVYKMKKDYHHLFLINNSLIKEKEYLRRYFNK